MFFVKDVLIGVEHVLFDLCSECSPVVCWVACYFFLLESMWRAIVDLCCRL